VAVELAILTLFDAGSIVFLSQPFSFSSVSGWRDCAVIIHSDNQGVIGSFRQGRSRNFQVNLCIRRSEIIAMNSNVLHVLSYTASADNKADSISRGEVGSSCSRLNHIQLPAELIAYISPYV
jgi:hypothetical protein